MLQHAVKLNSPGEQYTIDVSGEREERTGDSFGLGRECERLG